MGTLPGELEGLRGLTSDSSSLDGGHRVELGQAPSPRPSGREMTIGGTAAPPQGEAPLGVSSPGPIRGPNALTRASCGAPSDQGVAGDGNENRPSDQDDEDPEEHRVRVHRGKNRGQTTD